MYSFTIGSLAVSQFRSSTPPYLLSTGSLAMSQLQSGPQWLALQSAHPMVSLPRLACCPPGALPLGCDLFFAIVPLPLPKFSQPDPQKAAFQESAISGDIILQLCIPTIGP